MRLKRVGGRQLSVICEGCGVEMAADATALGLEAAMCTGSFSGD